MRPIDLRQIRFEDFSNGKLVSVRATHQPSGVAAQASSTQHGTLVVRGEALDALARALDRHDAGLPFEETV